LSTVLSNGRVAKRLRLSPTDLGKQRIARQATSASAGAETSPAFVDISISAPALTGWPPSAGSGWRKTPWKARSRSFITGGAPPSKCRSTMARAFGCALNVLHRTGSKGGPAPRPRPGACPPASCTFCSGTAIPRPPIGPRTGAGSPKSVPAVRYSSRATRRKGCGRARRGVPVTPPDTPVH
jgi:hypothetical protein